MKEITNPKEELIKELAKLRRQIVELRELNSKQNATEDNLRKSGEKYKSIVENLKAGIYRVTHGKDEQFIDVNKAFVDILGYQSKKEVLELKVSDIYFNPEDRIELTRKILAQGFVKDEKLLLKRKDGTPLTVLNTGTVVYDEYENPVYFDGILEDITKLKEAERDLRIKNCALESSINAIAIADLEGILVYVNQSFVEMWGYEDREKVIGKPAAEFWHDEKQAAETLKALVEKGGYIGEMMTRKRDGSAFSVQLSTSLVVDEEDNPLCMMGSFVDITDRKKAERALRESEEQFRNLFENARDVIVTFDLKGIVTSVNKAVEEFGFKKDELIGKNMLDFVLEKYWSKLLRELASLCQGDPIEGEIDLITPKGRKTVDYKSNPIRKGGEIVGIQTIIRDITERKKAEQKLKQYSDHLEEMVQRQSSKLLNTQEKLARKEKLAMVGQLAGSVGHDIRNPLGNIRNSSHFLNLKLRDANGKIRKHLDIIEKNIEQADKIVTDLLDFSKGRKPLLVKSIIQNLVEEAVDANEMPDSISIEMNLGKKVPEVYLDPYQILQAFSNIITNAVQAMPEGGKLKIATGVEDEFVFIQFEDTGKGISEENLQKIFEPLFTTKARGIGLGLAIVDNIISNHGGKLEVTSKVGKGTEFTVKLPRKNED